MTYENTFGQSSETAGPPDLVKIEEYYWRLVTLGTEHVCVHTVAIDTGEECYGFIKNKLDSYGRATLEILRCWAYVTVPTLLLGMLFSTSCWHKNPHAVSWLEYQLLGPERIWYGIPAHQADNFRKAVETLCPTFCQNKRLWMSSDITMIPPKTDGEYILAFPNAYTCCISTGYTEPESVYFAPPSWLENLWTVFKEARESCEPTMFAMEHLLYNIGNDPKAEHTILKIAQPLYDKMLREEVTNRQMLQEQGLPYQSLSANTSRKKNKASTAGPRCTSRRYLLDSEKYMDRDVELLQVLLLLHEASPSPLHPDRLRRRSSGNKLTCQNVRVPTHYSLSY